MERTVDLDLYREEFRQSNKSNNPMKNLSSAKKKNSARKFDGQKYVDMQLKNIEDDLELHLHASQELSADKK